jgi:hypothetical protein
MEKISESVTMLWRNGKGREVSSVLTIEEEVEGTLTVNCCVDGRDDVFNTTTPATDAIRANTTVLVQACCESIARGFLERGFTLVTSSMVGEGVFQALSVEAFELFEPVEGFTYGVRYQLGADQPWVVVALCTTRGDAMNLVEDVSTGLRASIEMLGGDVTMFGTREG